MDKRLFLIVVLLTTAALVWSSKNGFKSTKASPDYNSEHSVATSIKPADLGQQGAESKPALPGSPTVLGEPSFQVTVQSNGAMIEGIRLGSFRGQSTEGVRQLIAGGNQLELSFPESEWAYLSRVPYKSTDKGKFFFEDDRVSSERIYEINVDRHYIDHQTILKFKKQAPAYVFISLVAERAVPKEIEENEKRLLTYNKSGGQETWTLNNFSALKEDFNPGYWMGFSSRYFLNALFAKGESRPQFQGRMLSQNQIAGSFFYKVTGSDIRIPVRYYYGPKDISVLRFVGDRGEAAVDFGWFTVFAYPLLRMLQWINGFVHNFGVAIILLTIFIKLALYPLTLKSAKGMKEMQRIQPQIARLREQYENDKEKLNQEMMQLMKSNGYNPASGCLPIFIQMPVFIALYNVLYGAIDLYGAPFAFWIKDLSAKDPYFVMPVLLGLLMFVQQKLTPNTSADPAQQKMLMFMPLLFGFMMLWLPSGLTLYMLVNSIVSIIQQAWINRRLNNSGLNVAVVAV